MIDFKKQQEILDATNIVLSKLDINNNIRGSFFLDLIIKIDKDNQLIIGKLNDIERTIKRMN